MEGWAAAKDKGNASYKSGDLPAAIQHFSEAIESDKSNLSGQQHIFYSNRSAAYLALGRAKDALNDASKCVELSPGFAKGYSRRGAALYRLGRFADAASAYEQGLGIDPANADMRKGLAEARKAVEEYKTPTMAEAVQKLKGLAGSRKVDATLFLSRLLILFFAFLYVLPLPWRRLSIMCYRSALIASLFNYAYLIYNSHGRPRMSQEYVARVLSDNAGQYFFLALLLVVSKPYVIALLPIVLTEGMHALWFMGQCIFALNPAIAKVLESQLSGPGASFTRDPGFGALGSQRKWEVLFRVAPQYAIFMEVATGLTLALEMLTPYRNTIIFFLFWQYLQIRYMLDQRDTGVKRAFKQLDTFIMGYLSHPSCPALIGKAYSSAKMVAARAVQVPEPGAPRPTPKCTIM